MREACLSAMHKSGLCDTQVRRIDAKRRLGAITTVSGGAPRRVRRQRCVRRDMIAHVTWSEKPQSRVETARGQEVTMHGNQDARSVQKTNLSNRSGLGRWRRRLAHRNADCHLCAWTCREALSAQLVTPRPRQSIDGGSTRKRADSTDGHLAAGAQLCLKSAHSSGADNG